ncbi:MAG: orotate phosphoribosyltransferase [Bacteroidales bacterium]|nr:orotate phosphoribosyltransferase [Bacteroidales bacterium]MCF8457641.1 orotate phosphoribosyltransferase [Bacteroidales bacterium]
MSDTSQHIITMLLDIEAIKLSPEKPFAWASGWNSPIYCDNRKTLSFPKVRNYIKEQFAALILELYPEVEVIAGVATGAIAQGALVADSLELPFVYIRSNPKSHGMENLIEGSIKPGQKVVVIEDLISTGGSSLKAVDALRKAGCEVMGMLAIFSYGFKIAEDNFEMANCEITTLANYSQLIHQALETGLVGQNEEGTLNEWRKSPETWRA